MNLKDFYTKHKALIIGGLITLLASLFIIFVVVNIALRSRPNNHNESVYGIIKVGIDASLADPTNSWRQYQVDIIKNSLPELSRLGPSFVFVTNNSDADVVIYKAELNCRMQGVGRFFAGTKIIEIDPTCTTSGLELQTVVLHELGHFLGMQHICRDSQNNTNDCSNVGRGPAVMNPALVTISTNAAEPTFDEVYVGPFPVWQIQELDIKEFKRVWELRNRR